MPKCKAIHYLAVTSIIASQSAGAEPMSYKEYMRYKRFPNLSAESKPVQDYPLYNFSAPQPLPTQRYTPQPAPEPISYQPISQPLAPVTPQPSYLAPTQTTVSNYAQPEEAQEYAMRPAAPYMDTAVPRPQAEDIRRTPVMQPQPNPVIMQPPYQDTQRVEPPKTENEKILGGDITGSLGLVSDYTFRGLTQSKEGPAIQGGIEYQHDVGAYLGLWASNVDFNDGDEAQVEIDAYGGYRTAVTDDMNADIGLIYYAYPGANSNLKYDYLEFYAGAEYGIPVSMGLGGGFDVDKATIGASISYSPEFFAESGSAYYAKATAALLFANGLTLDGYLGKQWVEDNTAFLLPDYMDWSVGLAYALPKDFEVKLQYIDTNLDETECADGCDAKAVATLSKSF